MSEQLTPYNTDKTKKEQISEMFDTISGEYDGLNRAITFGVDKSWRKRLIAMAAHTNPDKVLDIASGTGDLAILMAQKTNAKEIIGADISEGMLKVGRQKIEKLSLTDRISMQMADSEALPFETDYFDVVTVAFGVRNFEHLDKGLSEILRVLKPGGVFLILETSVPKYPVIREFYLLHSHTILPFFGRVFSKDPKAYRYLSKSAQKFPYGEAFNNILKKNGFKEVKDYPQFFGAATIYRAQK